jgi:surface polysaccharide O-acyltransferase-like enzyme
MPNRCGGGAGAVITNAAGGDRSAMSRQTKRMHYLDNLRIYLTILVILHHATLAYGGMGDWGIRDKVTDEVSPFLFIVFNALNQSYFMTAFFLLAGYFTPRSLERKGAKTFLLDRAIRLGVPLLVYTTCILTLTDFLILRFYLGRPFQLRLRYEPGHLWFLQALFLFALIHVIFRAFKKSATKLTDRDLPSDAVIWIAVIVLSVLTFLVRLAYPVGETVLNMHPGHFVHYVFAFVAGIVAYRGDWLRRLTNARGKRWGYVALGTFPFFFVLLVLGGALESDANLVKFLGGFTWQAMSYAAWETIMMVAIILFLLYFFREKFDRAGALTKTMAASVYTVYIIHQIVLYSLNIVFLSVAIPSFVKFIAVSLLGVPLCFLLSVLIRKLPYARRVLG